MNQPTLRIGDIQSGKNPREYFDEAAMVELTKSIAAKGVIEPIIVRPIADGQYKIIAGERRWRASTRVFGVNAQIPVVIRDCDDGEAEDLALIENVQREQMSPAEEAQAAHGVLARAKGNKTEAAAVLGWEVSKLERRLALMLLTTEVRTALTERKIKLGHAELLAAIPPDKQNTTLDKIIQHNVSVAQVKSQLGKLANTLAAAPFDKADCATCQFNSSCQSALFDESLSDGYCTNPSCYDERTAKHLDGIAIQLREEVPRVEVITASAVVPVIKLMAQGRLGVGEEQAKVCKTCKDFGCTVSALPGSIGDVERDLCFGVDCNTKKVQDHLKAEAAIARSAENASTTVKARGGSDAEAKAAGAKAATAKKAEVCAKATAIISSRVKEYRLTLWRQIAAKVMFAKPEQSTNVLIALALSGKAERIDRAKVAEVFKHVNRSEMGASKLGERAAAVTAVEAAGQATLLASLAPSAMKSSDEADVRSVLHYLQVDMGLHWKLNQQFLDLLTKSEIAYLANEIGLDVAMGEKEFSKALSGKRDELIKKVLSVESFTYQGVVPRCLTFSQEAVPPDLDDDSHEDGGEDS